MTTQTGSEIAIVGMAGRFPGAPDLKTYWDNLRHGIDSVQPLADVSSNPERKRSNFVRVGGVLDGVDRFDAAFFDLKPHQAASLDPQHRLFLEASWKAMENAGQDPARFSGWIGVYAGFSLDAYLATVLSGPGSVDHNERLSKREDLAHFVSRQLGCVGPALTLQEAGASSLIAVHLAAQALLGGECDLALAGGVSASESPAAGYLRRSGLALSPDGTCRPFSAQAQGTVMGHGVGVVVLKRLAEALDDGDTIHGIILGSATGGDRAESPIDSQARVIRAAQLAAGVDADSITYMEANGAGDLQDDAFEVEASSQAFRLTTAQKNFCALGSVKSQLGHLDAAAGIAALIKTVLACKKGELPATLHAEEANPEIDFENSPFYLNTHHEAWATDGPRRAAVSALGLDGAVAHVIVEEPPAQEPREEDSAPQLLVLSARTQTALEHARLRLIEFLDSETEPVSSLPDIAQTLQLGRRAFRHRIQIVARDRVEAVSALRDVTTSDAKDVKSRPDMIFLLPDENGEAVGSTPGVETAPVFHQEIERCREALGFLMREDPRRLSEEQWRKPALAQPALFALEYAWTRQWMAWGVEPAAFLGYGLGEWVAACLAGVFQLSDALRLAVMRGRLTQQQALGVTLSVDASKAVLEPLLDEHEAKISAFETPHRVVVSGSRDAIADLMARLEDARISHRPLSKLSVLPTPALDDMARSLRASLSMIELAAPSLPLWSNTAGAWLSTEQAIEPSYWAEHLMQPAQIFPGVATVLKNPPVCFLETGPGETFSNLVRQQDEAAKVVASWRGGEAGDVALLATFGQLWTAGVELDWLAWLGQDERPRRRVPLPGYPFERQRVEFKPVDGTEFDLTEFDLTEANETEANETEANETEANETEAEEVEADGANRGDEEKPLDLSLIEHLGSAQLDKIFARLDALDGANS